MQFENVFHAMQRQAMVVVVVVGGFNPLTPPHTGLIKAAELFQIH